MSRLRIIPGVLALAGALGSGGGNAPGLAAQEAAQVRPKLGGHTFISNPATRDPFPRTFLRSTTGIGKTVNLILIPSFEIGDQIVEEVKGKLLFAELDFAYQHRVQDWLAVWGRFNLAGRLGTNTGALLAEGVTTVTGFELGWLLRLVETESVVLSGTANLWSDGFTDVDILRWADGLVGGESKELVESSPTVRGGGGLRFAWGINEGWGVLLTGEGGYGESPGPEAGSAWVSDLAAGLSLDLRAYTGVPVGFVLTGASRGFDREEGKPETRTNEIGLRTAFTGRNDFLVAIDTKMTDYDAASGSQVGVIRFALTLQYYF